MISGKLLLYLQSLTSDFGLKGAVFYLLLNNYVKMLKQYETVFIATPVLSEQQMKEAVAKYTQLIADNGGEVVY